MNSGYASTSAFAALVGIPVSIKISTATINICVTTAGFKKYKTMLRKRKRNMIK